MSPTEVSFAILPVKQLAESDTNPRRTFGDLSALAESIRQDGIRSPLKVRPTSKLNEYELVYGHRRLRAAKLAGLEEVPAFIVELTDQQVLEEQLAENALLTAATNVHMGAQACKGQAGNGTAKAAECRQMYRTAQSLEQVLGRRPSPEEIAFEMDVPAENIRSMMDASQHAIALERPVGDDGDSEFGDFIEDQDSPSPVESATQ
ncbi:MAG: sigma-70 domain-containing protein, partial [Myxococcales bacterium]